MTKKDKQIVDKNPGKTPYELLNEFQLSQQGFDELVAQQDRAENQKVQKPQLLTPQLSREYAEPELSSAPGGHHHDTDTVMVNDKQAGKTFSLSKFAADRWIRKNPKRYSRA